MIRITLALALCFVLSMGAHSQVFTTLVNFNGTNGMYPVGTLVQGADGNFYGTTTDGGNGGDGTVFKVTSQGVLTTLYVFCSQQSCADGQRPHAGLVQATDGNFYGTTSQGGNGYGTIFKITPQGTLATLHSFNFTDGDSPNGSLLQGTDGNFYGTTYDGGAWGDGTVFKITQAGELTTLHSFNITDGGYPFAGLIQAADGNFFGTTSYGGDHGRGTVFEITPQGSMTVVHSFDLSEGSAPRAPLIQAKDGNFYSTTFAGGINSSGTVFRMTPMGTLTTIYNFCSLQWCADGEQPLAGLVQGSDGNLYGTTSIGANHVGTIFKITPNGTMTVLHTFLWQDGSFPSSGLVQAADGSLYGTTEYGGPNADGTVFRLIVYPALSVAKSGMGTVISGEGRIYCGSACSYWYFDGTRIGLTALPAPGNTFSGWTGCDNTNGNFCSVTMAGAKNINASFNTANITLTSLSFKPTSVKGGQLAVATVTLSAPAPPGGVGIAITSDHPSVVHPQLPVVVPGGKSSVLFAVNTFPVKTKTLVTITATAGSSQLSGTLTVGTSSSSQSSIAPAPSEPPVPNAGRSESRSPRANTTRGDLPE